MTNSKGIFSASACVLSWSQRPFSLQTDLARGCQDADWELSAAGRAARDRCWSPAKPPCHFSECRLRPHGVGLSPQLMRGPDLPSSEPCKERHGVRLWEAQATCCSFLPALFQGGMRKGSRGTGKR